MASPKPTCRLVDAVRTYLGGHQDRVVERMGDMRCISGVAIAVPANRPCGRTNTHELCVCALCACVHVCMCECVWSLLTSTYTSGWRGPWRESRFAGHGHGLAANDEASRMAMKKLG